MEEPVPGVDPGRDRHRDGERLGVKRARPDVAEVRGRHGSVNLGAVPGVAIAGHRRAPGDLEHCCLTMRAERGDELD